MAQEASQRPRSATHGLVASGGFAAFVVALFAVRSFKPFGNDLVYSAMLIIAASTAAIFLVDLGWQKIHRQASTGLDFARDDPSWSRTLVKFAGLLGSLGAVALAYWMLSGYYGGDFFDNYYALLRLILAPWIALAIPYFYWIDRKMREPRDGYWHMGQLVLFRWSKVDAQCVGQHLLGWAIKGFFMPLMFSYMCDDLKALFLFNFDALTDFRHWYDLLYRVLFLADVSLGTLGYIMSFRLTDTHIRSSEPTTLGWLVALICYDPLWSMVGRPLLPFDKGYAWDAWLAYKPVLFALWGSGILLLVAVYVSATVAFGARFSNLTNRGIITNGPYRWTKHPAYLAKNLMWWMMAVPFMPRGTPDEAVRRCLLLLAVNFIYVMRAKTEEWHLSRDPDYVRYALWMEGHGLLRFLKHIPVLRFLTYRPPAREVAPA
jgi:protein-S-isoprenylcysteine O-methyltransferase Ste14